MVTLCCDSHVVELVVCFFVSLYVASAAAAGVILVIISKDINSSLDVVSEIVHSASIASRGELILEGDFRTDIEVHLGLDFHDLNERRLRLGDLLLELLLQLILPLLVFA